MRVAKGFDVADHRIVQELEAGDLVVTADIPLAAEVITRARRVIVRISASWPHLDHFFTVTTVVTVPPSG